MNSQPPKGWVSTPELPARDDERSVKDASPLEMLEAMHEYFKRYVHAPLTDNEELEQKNAAMQFGLWYGWLKAHLEGEERDQ